MTESDPDVPRVFRPGRALPTDVVRPTRATVDLESLRHNLRQVQKAALGRPVWAVLKADAYGHGAKAVGRTLERAGVDGICVALVEEGVELREAGIQTPILVMGGYYGSAYSELVHHRLTVVLQDPGQLEALASAVRASSAEPIAAHLKVDTGMGRLGAREADWDRFAKSLASSPEIRFEGLMTHFPNADTTDSDALGTELAGFERATQTFLKHGLRAQHRHAANSAAVFRGNACFDLVRPGIALYGVSPFGQAKPGGLSSEAETSLDRLRPVMSVSSRIVALRTLKPGDAVGYGSTWQANRPAVIATVPMGYADGLSRSLSNRGHLLVRGVQAPIVGAVSMDMTTIDVTDVDGVQLNDEVVLLGSGVVPVRKPGAEAPTLSAVAVARASGTIAWEVLTNISRRVPRFYLGA